MPILKHRLSERSLNRLEGLHPDMVEVVKLASSLLRDGPVDFSVGECVRTEARQKELVTQGASLTMRSRHLKSENGYCHAVDLIALINNKETWSWRSGAFYTIANAMKAAAHDLNIQIEWGGDWKYLKDGPHFQLPWRSYDGKLD